MNDITTGRKKDIVRMRYIFCYLQTKKINLHDLINETLILQNKKNEYRNFKK
jgi:hypothetical protein